MALDPPHTAAPSPKAQGAGRVRDKVRVRFRKGGDLRLVSHHDLMQVFERMLRRAAIPFHATEGFNPKPRMVFALSLALGIVGCEEVVEIELDVELPPEEVRERLARQAPPGLEVLSARRVERKASAQPRRVCYALAVPAERADPVREKIAALMAAPECWHERTRPQPRRLDLRPFLRGLALRDGVLEMDFWVTQAGTARPEEVAGLLGLQDLLDAGEILERTRLELHDEAGPDADGPPDAAPAERQPSAPVRESRAQPAPLLPGPLSFES